MPFNKLTVAYYPPQHPPHQKPQKPNYYLYPQNHQQSGKLFRVLAGRYQNYGQISGQQSQIQGQRNHQQQIVYPNLKTAHLQNSKQNDSITKKSLGFQEIPYQPPQEPLQTSIRKLDPNQNPPMKSSTRSLLSTSSQQNKLNQSKIQSMTTRNGQQKTFHFESTKKKGDVKDLLGKLDRSMQAGQKQQVMVQQQQVNMSYQKMTPTKINSPYQPLPQPVSEPSQQMVSILNTILDPTYQEGGLYLGDYRSAEDTQLINNLKIGAILSMMQQYDKQFPPSINHLFISLKDMESQNILQFFGKALNFIKINRFVKEKRTIIDPNQGFLDQLKQYEKEIQLYKTTNTFFSCY